MYWSKECSHRGISCTRKSGKRWFDSKYFLQFKVRKNINIKYLHYIKYFPKFIHIFSYSTQTEKERSILCYVQLVVK